MRLLLVEDDPMIGRSIHQALRQDGYSVDWVQDGQSAEAAAAQTPYDLVLLDLGLPRKGGLDVLAELRRRRNPVPVLVLTARDAVADRVKGLDTGADDYLVKPFDLDELDARVQAVARRAGDHPDPEIRLGAVTLNPADHRAAVDGREVVLTAREWAILERLLRRPGATVSRSQLEEALYAFGAETESNAVEVYVSRIRKKLGAALIETLRGVGYRVAA